MKNFFALAALLAAGVAYAVPQQINREQVEEMTCAFEHAVVLVDTAQNALNQTIAQGYYLTLYSHKTAADLCDDLHIAIAQLGKYKHVPGFAHQCELLRVKWNTFQIPSCYSSKKYKYFDAQRAYCTTYGRRALMCGLLTAIIYNMLDVNKLESQEDRIFVKTMCVAMSVICGGAIGHSFHKFEKAHNDREALVQEFSVFEQAFENGPKKRVQLAIDALLEIK